ncbi:MAG: NAD(P)/FAD-dependent oxidoreductase [Thermodesulfobacteriota bacterium]|nr:NAD(P)/FAD-dependent oxidoreductase [Thermodesulfobacteriota bacterium]
MPDGYICYAPVMDNTYDLFVIGAGPGGYSAALLAARKGMKVGIAESSCLGGTCMNTGCIPTKAYAESIHLYRQINQAKRFGIEASASSLEPGALKKRKNRIVKRLTMGIEQLLCSAGVDIYRHRAKLLEDKRVLVDKKCIGASNILIATGSRPKIAPGFDRPGVMSSNDIFELEKTPESIGIIGAGVIGMEMAHIFDALGSRVSVFEAMDRILPMEDEMVSKELARIYRRVTFMAATRIHEIRSHETAGKNGFCIIGESRGNDIHEEVDALLVSTGRVPSPPDGIDAAGIAVNASNAIEVNGLMQTSARGIYAVGDVTGGHMLAYTATRQAEVVVNCLAGSQKQMDYRYIPSIIFTDPEIASVGQAGTNSVSGTFDVSALGRARTKGENHGFARIICDSSHKIQKVTLMCPNATELISLACLALEKGMDIEEFLGPVFAHPTMAEMLKEAADDVTGMSIHKPS